MAMPPENNKNAISDDWGPVVLPTFTDMLSALVAEPSVSCTRADLDQGNRRVVERLADWLDALGFVVEILPMPEQPEKANLIATLGSGEGGVALAGHTDTVPFDEHAWRADPLALTVEDGRCYGLGACDMKGFFPIALAAAAEFPAARLKAPITVVATCDEESSMAGGRHLLATGRPKASAAIIGEPTGLRPVFAHKGFAVISIVLEGASGHSSNPDLGRNALDAMQLVMAELIAVRRELACNHRNALFEVASPTLNLGCLHAGDNPNRICQHAELQIDLRLLPGMDTDAVLALMRERVIQTASRLGVTATLAPLHPPVPPFDGAQDGGLARLLGQLSGKSPTTVNFGTEAPFYQGLGADTVVFGPGGIEQAHQPDEFLALTQVEPATRALTGVIAHYCR